MDRWMLFCVIVACWVVILSTFICSFSTASSDLQSVLKTPPVICFCGIHKVTKRVKCTRTGPLSESSYNHTRCIYRTGLRDIKQLRIGRWENVEDLEPFALTEFPTITSLHLRLHLVTLTRASLAGLRHLSDLSYQSVTGNPEEDVVSWEDRGLSSCSLADLAHLNRFTMSCSLGIPSQLALKNPDFHFLFIGCWGYRYKFSCTKCLPLSNGTTDESSPRSVIHVEQGSRVPSIRDYSILLKGDECVSRICSNVPHCPPIYSLSPRRNRKYLRFWFASNDF